MPSVPRIYRADPVGPVTQAQEPIPVVATMTWMTSNPTEVPALAVAWTSTAVQVEWTFSGQVRRDWISAGDVRRPGKPPRPQPPGPPPPPRPESRHRPRW